MNSNFQTYIYSAKNTLLRNQRNNIVHIFILQFSVKLLV